MSRGRGCACNTRSSTGWSLGTTKAALATLDMVSAVAPGQLVYGFLLVPIGACTLLLLTSTNSVVQTAAHDAIRGRVMGIYLLVFIGAAAIGGPLLGLVDEDLGPRSGMLLAGAVPAVATLIVGGWLAWEHSRRAAACEARQHPSLV